MDRRGRAERVRAAAATATRASTAPATVTAPAAFARAAVDDLRRRRTEGSGRRSVWALRDGRGVGPRNGRDLVGGRRFVSTLGATRKMFYRRRIALPNKRWANWQVDF